MEQKKTKKVFNDPFINVLPQLDLHGETADISRVLVKNFIDENYLLGKEKVVIIHGKGTGVLKKVVHETLKESNHVSKYSTDITNDGITIVTLKPLVKNL